MCALYFVCFSFGKCISLFFVHLTAGELQQLCWSRWLHAISAHLWNVTRHLHHRGSPAGTALYMIENCRKLLLSRSANLSLTFYFEIPAQIVTMGLFRTIALFYLGSFDSIVRRCMIQREQSKAANKRE